MAYQYFKAYYASGISCFGLADFGLLVYSYGIQSGVETTCRRMFSIFILTDTSVIRILFSNTNRIFFYIGLERGGYTCWNILKEGVGRRVNTILETLLIK